MSKVKLRQIPHTIFNIFVKATNKYFVSDRRHFTLKYLPCAVLPAKSNTKDVYVVDAHLSESTARKQR